MQGPDGLSHVLRVQPARENVRPLPVPQQLPVEDRAVPRAGIQQDEIGAASLRAAQVFPARDAKGLQQRHVGQRTQAAEIGLILASVVYVAKRIEKVNAKNIILAVIGMGISFFLSIKANPYSNDHFFYLFLCGVVGATGMIVPGISGSHLMLLMGNYELIVTDAIPSLTKFSTFGHGAAILAPFLLGALVSLVLFSHLLSWLMREYRDGTLAVLAGFMLGSLPVVYPWKEAVGTDYIFDLPPWNTELLMAVVMVALGALSVYVLELMARHTEKKQAERLQNPKPKKKRHGKKTKKSHVHASRG